MSTNAFIETDAPVLDWYDGKARYAIKGFSGIGNAVKKGVQGIAKGVQGITSGAKQSENPEIREDGKVFRFIDHQFTDSKSGKEFSSGYAAAIVSGGGFVGYESLDEHRARKQARQDRINKTLGDLSEQHKAAKKEAEEKKRREKEETERRKKDMLSRFVEQSDRRNEDQNAKRKQIDDKETRVEKKEDLDIKPDRVYEETVDGKWVSDSLEPTRQQSDRLRQINDVLKNEWKKVFDRVEQLKAKGDKEGVKKTLVYAGNKYLRICREAYEHWGDGEAFSILNKYDLDKGGAEGFKDFLQERLNDVYQKAKTPKVEEKEEVKETIEEEPEKNVEKETRRYSESLDQAYEEESNKNREWLGKRLKSKKLSDDYDVIDVQPLDGSALGIGKGAAKDLTGMFASIDSPVVSDWIENGGSIDGALVSELLDDEETRKRLEFMESDRKRVFSAFKKIFNRDGSLKEDFSEEDFNDPNSFLNKTISEARTREEVYRLNRNDLKRALESKLESRIEDGSLDVREQSELEIPEYLRDDPEVRDAFKKAKEAERASAERREEIDADESQWGEFNAEDDFTLPEEREAIESFKALVESKRNDAPVIEKLKAKDDFSNVNVSSDSSGYDAGDRQFGVDAPVLEDFEKGVLKKDEKPAPKDERNATIPIGELNVDPERFQFKHDSLNAKGYNASKYQGAKFNPDLAGAILVWRDPEDGKVYVVNGHHRYNMALNSGYDGDIDVKFSPYQTAKEAKQHGAIQNIADGKGTGTDVAALVRDGLTKDKMLEEGVAPSSSIMNKGLVLSQLSDRLFKELEQGRYLDEDTALIIAESLPNDDDRQIQFYEHFLRKIYENGEEPKKDYVEALATSFASVDGQKKAANLFGEEDVDYIKEVETRAKILQGILGMLRKDERTFGRINKKNTEALTQKNVLKGALDEDAAKGIKEIAKKTIGTIKEEAKFKGPLNDILKESVKQWLGAKTEVERNNVVREAVDRLKEYSAGVGRFATFADGRSGVLEDDSARSNGKLVSDDAPRLFEKTEGVGEQDSVPAGTGETVSGEQTKGNGSGRGLFAGADTTGDEDGSGTGSGREEEASVDAPVLDETSQENVDAVQPMAHYALETHVNRADQILSSGGLYESEADELSELVDRAKRTQDPDDIRALGEKIGEYNDRRNPPVIEAEETSEVEEEETPEDAPVIKKEETTKETVDDSDKKKRAVARVNALLKTDARGPMQDVWGSAMHRKRKTFQKEAKKDPVCLNALIDYINSPRDTKDHVSFMRAVETRHNQWLKDKDCINNAIAEEKRSLEEDSNVTSKDAPVPEDAPKGEDGSHKFLSAKELRSLPDDEIKKEIKTAIEKTVELNERTNTWETEPRKEELRDLADWAESLTFNEDSNFPQEIASSLKYGTASRRYKKIKNIYDNILADVEKNGEEAQSEDAPVISEEVEETIKDEQTAPEEDAPVISEEVAKATATDKAKASANISEDNFKALSPEEQTTALKNMADDIRKQTEELSDYIKGGNAKRIKSNLEIIDYFLKAGEDRYSATEYIDAFNNGKRALDLIGGIRTAKDLNDPYIDAQLKKEESQTAPESPETPEDAPVIPETDIEPETQEDAPAFEIKDAADAVVFDELRELDKLIEKEKSVEETGTAFKRDARREQKRATDNLKDLKERAENFVNSIAGQDVLIHTDKSIDQYYLTRKGASRIGRWQTSAKNNEGLFNKAARAIGQGSLGYREKREGLGEDILVPFTNFLNAIKQCEGNPNAVKKQRASDALVEFGNALTKKRLNDEIARRKKANERLESFEVPDNFTDAAEAYEHLRNIRIWDDSRKTYVSPYDAISKAPDFFLRVAAYEAGDKESERLTVEAINHVLEAARLAKQYGTTDPRVAKEEKEAMMLWRKNKEIVFAANAKRKKEEETERKRQWERLISRKTPEEIAESNPEGARLGQFLRDKLYEALGENKTIDSKTKKMFERIEGMEQAESQYDTKRRYNDFVLEEPYNEKALGKLPLEEYAPDDFSATSYPWRQAIELAKNPDAPRSHRKSMTVSDEEALELAHIADDDAIRQAWSDYANAGRDFDLFDAEHGSRWYWNQDGYMRSLDDDQKKERRQLSATQSRALTKLVRMIQAELEKEKGVEDAPVLDDIPAANDLAAQDGEESVLTEGEADDKAAESAFLDQYYADHPEERSIDAPVIGQPEEETAKETSVEESFGNSEQRSNEEANNGQDAPENPLTPSKNEDVERFVRRMDAVWSTNWYHNKEANEIHNRENRKLGDDIDNFYDSLSPEKQREFFKEALDYAISSYEESIKIKPNFSNEFALESLKEERKKVDRILNHPENYNIKPRLNSYILSAEIARSSARKAQQEVQSTDAPVVDELTKEIKAEETPSEPAPAKSESASSSIDTRLNTWRTAVENADLKNYDDEKLTQNPDIIRAWNNFIREQNDNPDPTRWSIGMARAHRKVVEAIRKVTKEETSANDAPVLEDDPVPQDEITMGPQLFGDERKRYEEIRKRKEPKPEPMSDDAPEVESLSPEESDAQEETTQEDAPVLAEYIDSDNKPVSAEEINEARKAYDEYLSAPLSDEERDAMKKRFLDQFYGNESKPDAPVIQENSLTKPESFSTMNENVDKDAPIIKEETGRMDKNIPQEPARVTSEHEGKTWKFDGGSFQTNDLYEHEGGAYYPSGSASVEDGEVSLRFKAKLSDGARRRLKRMGFDWDKDRKAYRHSGTIRSSRYVAGEDPVGGVVELLGNGMIGSLRDSAYVDVFGEGYFDAMEDADASASFTSSSNFANLSLPDKRKEATSAIVNAIKLNNRLVEKGDEKARERANTLKGLRIGVKDLKSSKDLNDVYEQTKGFYNEIIGGLGEGEKWEESAEETAPATLSEDFSKETFDKMSPDEKRSALGRELVKVKNVLNAPDGDPRISDIRKKLDRFYTGKRKATPKELTEKDLPKLNEIFSDITKLREDIANGKASAGDAAKGIQTANGAEFGFNGGRATVNRNADQIQIKFTGFPDADVRQELKNRRFRWSPENKVWYRPLDEESLGLAKELGYIPEDYALETSDDAPVLEDAQNATGETEDAPVIPDVEETKTETVVDKPDGYYTIDDGIVQKYKDGGASTETLRQLRQSDDYRQRVDVARKGIEKRKEQVDPKYHEKLDKILDAYERLLADDYNIRNKLLSEGSGAVLADERATVPDLEALEKQVMNLDDDNVIFDYANHAGQRFKFNGGMSGINLRANRFEIDFNDFPSTDTRNDLKGAGFRWDSDRKVWYKGLSQDTIDKAKKLGYITDKIDERSYFTRRNQ